MTRKLFCQLGMIGLSVAITLLSGCADTPPSRFYVLHALDSSQLNKKLSSNKQDVAIGVGPVILPRFLDRPQIVTRASSNKLELAEFDKWGEPLKDNFTRVLAENLSLLVSTDRVTLYPGRRQTPIDYQITVDVTQFHRNPIGEIVLSARWSVLGRNGKEIISLRKSSFTERPSGQDFESIVFAKSKALADLSHEIASVIRGLVVK